MNDKPGETPENANPPVSGDSSSAESSEPKTEVVTETASPVSQPMVSTTEIEAAEAARKAEEEKKKKSHKGLIIGLVIGFLVIIGGVIGTLFALGVFKPADQVVMAISKLFEGEKPANLGLSGKISVDPGASIPIDELSLEFKSSMKVGSLINMTDGTLTAAIDGNEYKVSIGEIYASNNELFLKVDGADSVSDFISYWILDQMRQTDVDCDDEDECDDIETATDCIGEEGTDCIDEDASASVSMNELIVAYLMQILEMVDGKWIRIPFDEIPTSALSFEANTECVVGLFNSSSKNSNKLAEIYNKNAFISSTTENLSVAKKNDPIYKLVFDGDKLKSYTDELKSSNIFDASCFSEDADVNMSELNEQLKKLPDIYLEINSEHDITRFYTTMSQEGGIKAEIDLSFSYPSTIDVAEPIEYYDLMDILGGSQ